MTEEQKAIVRQQQAGFKELYRLETQELRAMTFEQRLAGFRRIQSMRPKWHAHDPRADDQRVTDVWTKIRERYASRL